MTRTKQGTTRADLNEIKDVISLQVELAINRAIEPLVNDTRMLKQTVYGESGNNGLRGTVKNVSDDQASLREEFNEEKNKLKGVAAVLAAIGSAVGVASSLAAKALWK